MAEKVTKIEIPNVARMWCLMELRQHFQLILAALSVAKMCRFVSDPEVLPGGHGPAAAGAGDGFPGPRDEQGEGMGAAHEETRAGEKEDGRPDGRNEGVKRKHEVSPERFC